MSQISMIDTYRSGDTGHGAVALRQPHTGRALVDSVDPQLLEGGVRRGGRYERGGNCELDEHFCDKTDV